MDAKKRRTDQTEATTKISKSASVEEEGLDEGDEVFTMDGLEGPEEGIETEEEPTPTVTPTVTPSVTSKPCVDDMNPAGGESSTATAHRILDTITAASGSPGDGKGSPGDGKSSPAGDGNGNHSNNDLANNCEIQEEDDSNCVEEEGEDNETAESSAAGALMEDGNAEGDNAEEDGTASQVLSNDNTNDMKEKNSPTLEANEETVESETCEIKDTSCNNQSEVMEITNNNLGDGLGKVSGVLHWGTTTTPPTVATKQEDTMVRKCLLNLEISAVPYPDFVFCSESADTLFL
eukprot:sb/3467626/